MEGVAALSLAANVIQVVSFSHRILSAARETYKNGFLRDNAALEQLAEDLKSANESLQQRLHQSAGSSLSKDDKVGYVRSPDIHEVTLLILFVWLGHRRSR